MRLLPCVIVAAGISACASTQVQPAGISTPGASTTAECRYPTSTDPAAKNVGKPPANPPTASSFTATIAAGQGAITIKLDAAEAPCTVNSFVYLAGKKYFDATHCHRLTTAGIFVLQCGDPTGTGSGGPGYTFADENLKGAVYPAGTVAMANAGPGTNGSQFFLVYKDTNLDPNYTPFGTITGGLEVIQKIAAAGSDDTSGPGDGRPKSPVDISRVTITRN